MQQESAVLAPSAEAMISNITRDMPADQNFRANLGRMLLVLLGATWLKSYFSCASHRMIEVAGRIGDKTLAYYLRRITPTVSYFSIIPASEQKLLVDYFRQLRKDNAPKFENSLQFFCSRGLGLKCKDTAELLFEQLRETARGAPFSSEHFAETLVFHVFVTAKAEEDFAILTPQPVTDDSIRGVICRYYEGKGEVRADDFGIAYQGQNGRKLICISNYSNFGCLPDRLVLVTVAPDGLPD